MFSTHCPIHTKNGVNFDPVHALFVGQWAAPFLLLGIYNKMVKQHGSDAGVKQDSRIVA
jgi:hypothetical protein